MAGNSSKEAMQAKILAQLLAQAGVGENGQTQGGMWFNTDPVEGGRWERPMTVFGHRIGSIGATREQLTPEQLKALQYWNAHNPPSSEGPGYY